MTGGAGYQPKPGKGSPTAPPKHPSGKARAKPNGAAPAASLLRDTILAADDMRSEAVEMPEWGVTVHVRTLSLGDREDFEGEAGPIDAGASNAESVARIVAMTAFDAGGDRIFGVEDIPALAGKASRPLMRLFNVADRLNRITESQIGALAKN